MQTASVLLIVVALAGCRLDEPGRSGREDVYRARVLSVENQWADAATPGDGEESADVNREPGDAAGPRAPAVQRATAEILDGEFAGEQVELRRRLAPDRQFLSVAMVEGMDIIVRATGRGENISFHFEDVVRQRGLLYLLVGFALVLLLVGRWHGLRTLFTLALTAVVLFYILIPLLLAGMPPIPVAVASAVGIVSCILLTIGGVNVKSLAAILGTSAGLVVAGVLAHSVGVFVHLTGFGEMGAVTNFGAGEGQLLISRNVSLDIRGLLFAGIIIGSLGAITDVGMSIASAAEQIKRARPDMARRELTRSGMSVGRDIMGTMTNTLLLAYVGGALNLLLVFSQAGVGWFRIINMDIVATEVVRGLAGTTGLVIAIPITAWISAALMCREREGKARL